MSTKLVHTNGYLGKDTGKHPVWVEAQEQPFIITLTPGEGAISGEMDKTPAEILEAYKAGYRFVFFIPKFGNTYISVTNTIEVDLDEDDEPDAVMLQGISFFRLDGVTESLIRIVTGIDSSSYGAQAFVLE